MIGDAAGDQRVGMGICGRDAQEEAENPDELTSQPNRHSQVRPVSEARERCSPSLEVRLEVIDDLATASSRRRRSSSSCCDSTRSRKSTTRVASDSTPESWGAVRETGSLSPSTNVVARSAAATGAVTTSHAEL